MNTKKKNQARQVKHNKEEQMLDVRYDFTDQSFGFYVEELPKMWHWSGALTVERCWKHPGVQSWERKQRHRLNLDVLVDSKIEEVHNQTGLVYNQLKAWWVCAKSCSTAAWPSVAVTLPDDTTSSRTRALPALYNERCSLSTSLSIAEMALSTAASWPTGTLNSDR